VIFLKTSEKYLKFRLIFGLLNRKEDDSRKDAKAPRFGEQEKNLSLRPWRLGAISLLEVVLFNIAQS
jgi:hypothetical protein